MTTPTPRTVRLRSGITTVNGITGETAPTYSEYVLLEDYERDLAAAKDTISKYHERIISQHAQIDDLKWSLWKIEGKHKAAILEVITKLAAAQEARQADEDRLWSAIGGREAHWIEHHDEDGTLRRDQLTLEGALIFLHGASERSQRAEALAESFRKDAERYRYIKDDRRGKFVEALALRDAENWDAAIDSAKERANG